MPARSSKHEDTTPPTPREGSYPQRQWGSPLHVAYLSYLSKALRNSLSSTGQQGSGLGRRPSLFLAQVVHPEQRRHHKPCSHSETSSELNRLGALASRCSTLWNVHHKGQPWRSRGRSPFHTKGPRLTQQGQMDHTPSDVETETIHFPIMYSKAVHHKGDVETETIHFTQDVHHPILRENHPKVPPKVPGFQKEKTIQERSGKS